MVGVSLRPFPTFSGRRREVTEEPRLGESYLLQLTQLGCRVGESSHMHGTASGERVVLQSNPTVGTAGRVFYRRLQW
jgi:hypothetical protein